MKCAGFSLSKPFVRLVALIVSYSVISPYFVLFGTDRFRPFPLKSQSSSSRPKPVGESLQTIGSRYRDGQILVRFKESIPRSEADALLQTYGLHRAGSLIGPSGIEKLTLAEGTDPVTVATALRANQLVAFAEPNFLISADTVTPNDPRFRDQWALNGSGADIGVMSAWGGTTGSPRTIIAVIDSGADFSHPELRNNQWSNSAEEENGRDDDGNGYADDLRGWDFVAGDGVIRDQQGHGTAVAGIIAAEGNNGVGIAGVMWHASLMSLRVLDNSGTGDIGGAVQAIDYAALHGAQVINLSWGLEDGSSALLEAIDRAGARGVLVVCSAGNSGRDIDIRPHFPASFDLPNLIAVAATDNANLLASWSNRGTRRLVRAPGANILTLKNGGDYQAVNGTSASAAFVSGIAGLLRTLRPWLSAENTGRMISTGARSISASGDDAPSERIADAGRALRELRQLAPDEGLTRRSGGNGGAHEPGSGPRPARGLPGATLPTLQTLRMLPYIPPQAPPPIPSTMPNRVWESQPIPIPNPSPEELAFSKFSNDPFEKESSPLRSESSLLAQLLGMTRDLSDTDFSVFSSFMPTSRAASVFPPQYSSNLALNKPATQSTTLDPLTSANKAVDGTNGDLWGGYTAATNIQYQPWWHVDLQSVQQIGSIELWPRSDCCTEHLANFYVLVSDQPFTSTDLSTTLNQVGVSNYYATGNSFSPTAITINRTGRYVRVQRSDTQYLVISEAKIWGSSLTTARLDSINRTGASGEDLLSRNFNWGIPILGLRGRAGLDLGLSLSYNSLV